MMALVEPIPLPLKPRYCSMCEHGYIGVSGVYCIEFRELVNDETVALDCESWEPA
jgi:hypothetical protein